MLLAVDAGNTDTVIGLYDLSVTDPQAADDGLVDHWRIATHAEYAPFVIEADPSRNVTDVSGVGEEAFFDDLGGVAQLVAKGERYFVGVTFVYETPESGIETGKQIVAAMLAAAES